MMPSCVIGGFVHNAMLSLGLPIAARTVLSKVCGSFAFYAGYFRSSFLQVASGCPWSLLLPAMPLDLSLPASCSDVEAGHDSSNRVVGQMGDTSHFQSGASAGVEDTGHHIVVARTFVHSSLPNDAGQSAWQFAPHQAFF